MSVSFPNNKTNKLLHKQFFFQFKFVTLLKSTAKVPTDVEHVLDGWPNPSWLLSRLTAADPCVGTEILAGQVPSGIVRELSELQPMTISSVGSRCWSFR